MTPDTIQSMIETGLPGAKAEVNSPDNVHFDAVVISASFEGQRTMQRHRSVYATLGEHMGTDIHALSLRTMTPAEAAS
jgi:acid stress-induced BolA-like protein IbaG/YrbA